MSKQLAIFLYIISALIGFAFTRDFETASVSNRPPGPDRYEVITVAYTAYEWWMVSWKEEQVVCSMIVDHEGIPTSGEVYRDCGVTIHEEWISQNPV